MYFTRMLKSEVVTVPNATVETLKSLLVGTAFQSGTVRLTIQNIGSNNIEIAWNNAATPTTTNMGIILPYDSLTFELETAMLDYLYVHALTGDTKAFVWQGGLA